MVVMSAPATADTGVTHERVATPFTCTVQAPQCAPPQPNLVPFMSNTSRSTQSSGISLGTSTVVDFPLTLNVTGMIGPFVVYLWILVDSRRVDGHIECTCTCTSFLN